MRGESCVLVPLAGNEDNKKPSELYKSLYTLTGKNRKLTNFLYALSLQPEIKALFSKSDLNNQKEPKLSALRSKLEIDAILSQKDKLNEKQRELNAIDNRGNVVYYDDIFHIIHRVQEFNRANEAIKAAIKYATEGFYIEVDTINSDNYNFNNVIQYRLELLQKIKDIFANEGINVELSEESKKYINPLNIHFAINQLKNLGSGSRINPALASLLIDLFKDDPIISRLRNQLGNNLKNAISQATGYTEFDLDLSDYQEEQIRKAIKNISTKLKRILSASELSDIRDEINDSISYEGTYMDVSSSDIRDTLKELYSKFNIDQDIILDIETKVKSLSEAADRLFKIKLALENEKSLKTGQRLDERNLSRKQKLIKNGDYIVSIVNMLNEILTDIKKCEKILARESRALSVENPSIDVVNRISKEILRQLDVVNAYSGVIASLARGEHLQNDDVTGNDEMISNIISTAEEISRFLRDIKDNAEAKQEEVVKAFLTLYWGKEGKTLPDGTVVTVDDIMKAGLKDPNLFERFIYSAATSSDEMMNIIAQAAREKQDDRDDWLKKHFKEVRSITQRVLDSGSDTSFMFELDKDGYPKKIISNYDYDKFYEEYEAYKDSVKNDPKIGKDQYEELFKNWYQKHTKSINYKFTTPEGRPTSIELTVPIYEASISVKKRLTDVQYAYYKKMMDYKAYMLSKIQAADNNTLFDVIEVSADFMKSTSENGLFKAISQNLGSLFKQREDDTEYGDTLRENNIKLTHVNYKGNPIQTLPLFYTHKLEDRSRVSKDFSRSMCMYMAASMNYIQLNSIVDALLLTKDFMLTKRKVQETSGKSNLIEMQKLGKSVYVRSASKLGMETGLNGLAEDFFEKVLFNKRRKNGSEISIFGTNVKVNKISDAIVGYTSIAGLSLNILGAEANLLVGKLQMLIDASCGEFFNLKDMGYAEAKYFRLLPELWAEIGSNKKSSMLGLLMEKFDVLENFYDSIKETGFYKNPISKIIGNTNLFMLYGLGEHLLHAEGMLAVLHNKKNMVKDDKGNLVPLIEAFRVIKDDTGNGELVIKEGYTRPNGSAIDKEYLRKIKGRIAYTNKTMHGAFNTFDKGMIHRYAFGRLIMNFRQWMPAHYQRRFRGRYYDTDLEEYREGFYISTWRFLSGVVSDLKQGEFHILQNFRNLSDLEKYNVKRAIAETVILCILSGLICLGGDYKDKKGNWAYRHWIYELKRLQMETMASNPITLYGFVKNIITILNSPMACLNTIEKLSNFLKLTDVFVTIEDGKYQGENLYVHNLLYSLPFYRQIMNMSELGESDVLFKIYEK